MLPFCQACGRCKGECLFHTCQGINRGLSASFNLQLSSVVAERERGLRRALKTAGMLESGGCEVLPLGWRLRCLMAAAMAASLPCCVFNRALPRSSPPSLPAAFWLSWLAVEILAAVLFTLLLIAFGAMFQVGAGRPAGLVAKPLGRRPSAEGAILPGAALRHTSSASPLLSPPHPTRSLPVLPHPQSCSLSSS